MLELSLSCSSAKRNQVRAISSEATRASPVEAKRAVVRHSCARRRYSSALARGTAATLVCTLPDKRKWRRRVPKISKYTTDSVVNFKLRHYPQELHLDDSADALKTSLG